MIPVLLLGGVALAAGIAIAAYWKEINAWVQRIWAKLPHSVKDKLQGAVALARRIGNTFKNIMKYYAYDSNTKKWTETVVTKEVNESDIPKHIRSRLRETEEVDISEDFQKELQLSL